MAGLKQRLDGKVALVTGAAQGMGLSIAEAYLLAGAHVALVDRNADQLDAAAQLLEARGLSALTLHGDIRDEVAVDGAVQAVLGAFGRIDVLVNNAALLMTFV